MSDEKKPEVKDVERKPLSRERLEDQVKESERIISAMQAQVTKLQRDIEQNIGVLNHTRFLLEHYEFPSVSRKTKTKLEEAE